MTDDRLYIEYIYRGGTDSELSEQHRKAIESTERYEYVGAGILSTQYVGDVTIEPYIDVHDRWSFVHGGSLSHTTPDGEQWDLTDCPLIAYRFDENRFLIGGDTHPWSDNEHEPLEAVIDLVKLGYTATGDRPVVVYAETPDMPHIGHPPCTARSLADWRLTHLCWLTIFTPNLVDTYGRETLLSAPAWHVEELEDGAILLVCHDDPTWETSLQPVADHIGLPTPEDVYRNKRR
ncbi:hypothetical protein [Natronobiforma cellulositropha]|uniref:hypothetical protein n=1 Tax=Natronobiforma cellulositropha TaxID=1679076 RepID=UPI0021D5C18F|nr:hypothetical protein [Natronobiforma cellulositropha]